MRHPSVVVENPLMYNIEFTTLIQALEVPNAPISEVEKLIPFLSDRTIDFYTFLHMKMNEKIHPEQLLALAENLEKIRETYPLGLDVTKVVVRRMAYLHKNHDHFYYMCRHDSRINDSNTLKYFVELLSNDILEKSIILINEVYQHINLDKYTLLAMVIAIKIKKYSTIIHSQDFVIDKLSLEDRYQVLVKSLELNDANVFAYLEEDLVDANFAKMIADNFTFNTDQDPLAIAIRNSTIDISVFDNRHFLNAAFNSNMPLTLDFLFKKAEKAGLWYYVLELGLFKPKKELLRSIVQSKDQQLIEKFFALYNADPEVKHLTIFS
jgi:hypothetical protein